MSHCLVTVTLENGDKATLTLPISRAYGQFDDRARPSINTGYILDELRVRGWLSSTVKGISLDLTLPPQAAPTAVDMEAAGLSVRQPTALRSRRLSACRTTLALAHQILPAHVRRDFLEQWVDEIETAALKGRPILRRTVSIALRGAPRIALRARRPARTRRERG